MKALLLKKKWLLCTILAIAVFASACSSSNNAPKRSEAQEASYDADYEAMLEEKAPEEAPEAAAPMDGAASSADSGVNITLHSGNIDPAKQKIIRDAHISIESKSFESTVSQLSEKAVQLGGYLQSSQLYSHHDYSARSMEMTLRIPYQNFDSFLKSARAGGTVLEEKISTQDVSSVYFDSQARLKSLQIKLERFESIMAASARLEDVLRLENEIADVRYEIERLQGSMNNIDDQVRYSSVTIVVNEWVDRAPSIVSDDEDASFAARLRIAFSSTAYNFVSFFQGLIIVIIYLLPLLIIAAIALPVFFYFRKRRKAKKALPSLSKKDDPPANE